MLVRALVAMAACHILMSMLNLPLHRVSRAQHPVIIGIRLPQKSGVMASLDTEGAHTMKFDEDF